MIEQGGSRPGAQGLLGDGERDELELRLGRHAAAVQARLERWTAEDFGRRLWAKDHALWSPQPVPELSDRLGWLKLPESMRAEMEDLARFGQSVREGIRDVVVLGMGGSSLAPEVFSRVFGSAHGFPALAVLDSTHPEAVRAVADRLDPTRSLFVVSSKSGGTAETMSLFRAFWQWTAEALASKEEAGRRFVAVTDPGTSLERLARERGFRAVFNAPEDVGGRYSALTNFGLVPAALIGADLRGLLGRARVMAESCVLPVPENPGVRLGAALGELALAGRDKVTFLTSKRLASFPDWLEQLIAESTGKHGRGIVPVVGEPLGTPLGETASYGADRFFVALLAGGAEDVALLARLGELERAGHPVARVRLAEDLDLGREMFRWEMATAAAGAVLGVNPFDQPDVQLAKDMANQAMKAGGAAGGAGGEAVPASDPVLLGNALQHWLAGATPGVDYAGIHAWLPAEPAILETLREIQGRLRDRTGLAVTLGFGPRFLHSTGQLHKGGPATGRFLQLVDTPAHDLPVPETDYTFGRLLRAQADGDRAALEQRGRSVLRLELGADISGGLAALREALGA